MDVEKQEYLIPANSKRGILILSIYRPVDLAIVISGALVTFSLFFILGADSFGLVIIELLPLLIGAFLTLPIPNYHNTLVLIKEIVNYFSSQKEYKWKGWCVYDEK